MSYSETAMRSMGDLNNGWGICGFTGALYDMYNNNAASRPVLMNAPRPFTVLSEIKIYLKLLYATANSDLLDEIERFTRSFGVVNGFDFGTFTPGSYIHYIDAAASKYIDHNNQEMTAAICADPKFSIALPPQAVADYLVRMWGAVGKVSKIDPGGDAIVGVSKPAFLRAGGPYDGLCHWVYRKGGKIHSWGKQFSSVRAANADYTAIWFVSTRKN